MRKVKIGIIARGLTKGGVTRYIKNLLYELNRFSKDKSNREKYEFLVFTDEPSFTEEYPFLKIVYIWKSPKIWWDYFKILPKFANEAIDCMIYPKYIIPFTHLNFSFKKINVIHDLAYFDDKLNEYKFFDSIYMKSLMKYSCKRSDKAIAISNSTKKDLTRILDLNKENIKVIYEGVDKTFNRLSLKEGLEVVKARKIRKPFLFYCGSLSPRKNMLSALKAFNKIKDQHPHKIYISGGQSWKDKPVLEYIHKNLSDRVYLTGYLSEEELIAMYSLASIFLYPSLYEGFGLPILEAQACGCPVITSNVTSMPEVAGKGAILVDPYNVDEIAEAMEKVIKDKKLRKHLIKEGYKNIKRFSWERCARETLKVCEGVLKEK